MHIQNHTIQICDRKEAGNLKNDWLVYHQWDAYFGSQDVRRTLDQCDRYGDTPSPCCCCYAIPAELMDGSHTALDLINKEKSLSYF